MFDAKMKPRFKIFVFLVPFVIAALCLLLFALLLSPDPDSLAYLQAMIIEKGWCSVSVRGSDYIIMADLAKIDNDALILTRTATSGDNSLVVVAGNSGSPVLAKSITIRFIKDQNDILELSLHEPNLGKINSHGTFTMKLYRRWNLRERFEYFRLKIKNSLK